MSIKKAPAIKKGITRPIQCANCGKVIEYHSDGHMIDPHDDLYICDDCYFGFMSYLRERDHLEQNGNLSLLQALDTGTAPQYENIKDFVNYLVLCYTKKG